MYSRKVRNSLLAGLCGSAVHSTLMAAKDYFGIVPEFQPYHDVQNILATIVGDNSPILFRLFIPYVTGALFVGFLFGRAYAHLPGKTAIAKGAFFGVVVWLLMGFGFFNLAGHGIFALDMGLGLKPAMLSLAMLLIYSVTMSLVYKWLNAH